MGAESWYQALEAEIDAGWDGYAAPDPRDFELSALQDLREQLDAIDWSAETRESAHEVRERLFCLRTDHEYAYLAHGSYGATFRLIAGKVAAGWRNEMETEPVVFFYQKLAKYITRSHFEVARYCFSGLEPKDVVLCENVEVGMNSFVTGLTRAGNILPGDSVAVTEFVYGATRSMLKHLLPNNPILEIPMPPNASITGGTDGDKPLLDSIQQFLGALDSPPKLLILEHVTSPSAIRFPIGQIAKAARALGVQFILVDGAHALGALSPVAPKELDVDCYVTNGHKWFCNARGAAACFVRRSLQENTRSPVVSWGNNYGFHSSFIWHGTSDYTPLLTMWSTIQVWKTINRHLEQAGFVSVLHRNAKMANSAAVYLENALGTTCLTGLESPLPMLVVPIPEELKPVGSELGRRLREDFSLEVPVFVFRGVHHIRISVHLYTSMSEIHQLYDALMACLPGKESK